MPSMTFIKTFAKAGRGVCKAVVVFSGEDCIAMPILRLFSYKGASLHINIVPFLSEAEFDTWF
jgi:hypothetical protein